MEAKLTPSPSPKMVLTPGEYVSLMILSAVAEATWHVHRGSSEEGLIRRARDLTFAELRAGKAFIELRDAMNEITESYEH